MTLRKIGWILLSPPEAPQPSTRIAAINMMEVLPAHGYTSCVLHAPAQGTERPQLPPLEDLLAKIRREQCDIVAIQKVHGDSVLALAQALRAEGIPTAFLICDLVLPVMSEATGVTVVVSEYLRSLYPQSLQHKVKVVHDGIERDDLVKTAYGGQRGSRGSRLSGVMVTNAAMTDLGPLGPPPSWLDVTVLGRYPSDRSLRTRLAVPYRSFRAQQGLAARLRYLRFLSDPGIHLEAWSQARAYEALLAADIGIISVPPDPAPADGSGLPPSWKRRSENRLTLMMSLGLPVVASPVPAYFDVVEQGVNGFIATSRSDWRRCLTLLRDPGLRQAMGVAARQSVVERYSKSRQALDLAAAFDALLQPPG